jgi:hypothetical protein
MPSPRPAASTDPVTIRMRLRRFPTIQSNSPFLDFPRHRVLHRSYQPLFGHDGRCRLAFKDVVRGSSRSLHTSRGTSDNARLPGALSLRSGVSGCRCWGRSRFGRRSGCRSRAGAGCRRCWCRRRCISGLRVVDGAGVGVRPLLFTASAAGVEGDLVAVGGAGVAVVQALACDGDGSVGLEGPLLGGVAVAGVGLDLVAVGGASGVVVPLATPARTAGWPMPPAARTCDRQPARRLPGHQNARHMPTPMSIEGR